MAAKETTSDLEQAAVDHPVGTTVGAAGGAVAGVTAGSVLGGPIGAVVGGVVGAVAGSLVGRGAAETAHPQPGDAVAPLPEYGHEQDSYWREQHVNEPYFDPQRNYDDYAPAYRLGWEHRARTGAAAFDEHEAALREQWEHFRAQSRLSWAEAQHAARASWERFDRRPPGHPDPNAPQHSATRR